MGTVKNQHYIQEKVLREFADNNQTYEVFLPENKIYKTNISNSMSSKYTYESSRSETNFLEKQFGKMESEYTKKLLELLRSIETLEKDQNILASVLTQIYRLLPSFLIYYYRSGAVLYEIGNHGGNINEDDKIDKVMANIFDSNYINNLSKTIQYNYEVSIIKSSNQGFIISDQFLSTASLNFKSRFINGTNRMIGFRDVIVLIPLSSTYYLVFLNGKPPKYIQSGKICNLLEDEISQVNNVIINNSYVKAVCLKEINLVKSLKNFTHTRPSMTFAKFDSGNHSMTALKKEVFFYERDKSKHDFLQFKIHHDFSKLQFRDECLCGSGKFFGNCCRYHYRTVMKSLKKDPEIYNVKYQYAVERNITDYYGHKQTIESMNAYEHIMKVVTKKL
ncbi:hypothetical protein KHQ82_08775 [Mycoplasmatota bacterium]|nr:hypothetical protein KHQ82_08775 [Mycoplasmatota bacterium]